MIKKIELSEIIINRLVEGKSVEGSLHRDEWTGKITFKPYNRKSREEGYVKPERVIALTETGWLKESAQRIKFFSSVKKTIGTVKVTCAMKRDLDMATGEMLFEGIDD